MPLELEELFREYRNQVFSQIERSYEDLDTFFKNEFRKLSMKVVDSFDTNRFNSNNLDQYVHDNMEDLRNKFLKKEKENIKDEFFNNYNSMVRQIEEISSTRLEPNELYRSLRSVVSKFQSLFSIPNPNFIEGYYEEFRDNIGRKYDLSSNFDLKFEINRLIRKSSDNLMDEYYSTIKALNLSFVEKLSYTMDEAQSFIIKQNEQIDKINQVDNNLDPNKPIDTNGKSKEQLVEEQRVLGEKIMNDPNLSFEEKTELYIKVVSTYQNAIDNIDPQLNGKISIKGKTVKDLENEKRLAIERVTKNPNLDLDEILEELDRIKTLYNAAIKAISPVPLKDLKDKTQEELAHEKEEAIRKIMGDTTMSDVEKMELYDRVVAQYDTAIEKSPTKAQKTLDALII